jgi:uncharacterized protein (TIGR02145 family)
MRNTLLLFVGILMLSSCEKNDEPYSSQKVVDIDGNVYNTVTIGSQVWMAENLKVTRLSDGTPTSSIIPINDSNYINNYGRLYDWETATKVCPNGWHLPSDHEWFVLLNYLDKTITNPDSTGFLGEKTGDMVKSYHLWPGPNSSIANSTGFSALPSGYFEDGQFVLVGFTTNFWSSTEGNEDQAFGGMNVSHNSESIFRGYMNKVDGLCVRCLKDK